MTPSQITNIILGIITIVCLVYIFAHKCDCKKVLQKYQVGFNSEYSVEGDPETLKLSTLQPAAFLFNGDTWVLEDKPVIFPKGIKIKMDAALTPISSKEIEDDMSNTKDKKENILSLITTINEITQDKSIDDMRKDLSDLIIRSTQHYVQLITSFLAENTSAKAKWGEVLDYLYAWLQIYVEGKKGKLPPVPEVPDIGEIYDWLKYSITKVGGLSAILKRFQKRIKHDLIQSIANSNDDYRYIDPEAEKIPSGKCSFYPLSWWQSCPNGTKPVGNRGWSDEKNEKGEYVNACNKWYQYWSGELLCSPYATNYKLPVRGTCLKIIDAASLLENNDVIKIISISLSTILGALSVFPQVDAVLKTITAIFTLALPYVKGNYDWLLKDLKDVCYNFMCKVNGDRTTDTVCNGVKTADGKQATYCIPGSISDSDLASRDCDDPSVNCNTKPAGTCMSEDEYQKMIAGRKDDLLTSVPGFYNIVSGDSDQVIKLSEFI